MIVAIIQARMSSTRLPGKVMQTVLGKPLIWYLLERLSFAKLINKIVVATSVDPKNDKMVEYVQSLGFEVYRGKEDDVLDRYYRATALYKADHIVRITADCPLIEPEFCDQLISLYLKEKPDYAHLSPKFAEGLDCEIFSRKCLEIAYQNAKLQSEREHVTLYLNNHLGDFKKKIIDNTQDDSKYRITVDDPLDFEVVRAVLEALYKEKSKPFKFGEVKAFLDQHPGIYQKNAHIIRNEGLLISLKKDKEVERDLLK